MHSPCLIMGDSNAILYVKNKVEGREVGNSNNATFIRFVNYMAGIDIGFQGKKFTWDNGGLGRHNIWD